MDLQPRPSIRRVPLNSLAIIQDVPGPHREAVIRHVFSDLVRQGIRPWEWNHLRLMLKNLPEGQRAIFLQYAAPGLVFRKLPDAHWHALRSVLKVLPDSAKRSFFSHTVPALLDARYSLGQIEQIGRDLSGLLRLISSADHALLIEKRFPALLAKRPHPAVLALQARLAEQYHRLLEEGRFASSVVAQNFGYLPALDARGEETMARFRKTGGVLIPLLGLRTGKILRIHSKESFQQWKKALRRGIDVEPVLRSFDLPNGKVLVVTKYLGHNGEEHLEKCPQDREAIENAIRRLEEELTRERIRHGHLHERNVVVRKVGSTLRFTAIDFDGATPR